MSLAHRSLNLIRCLTDKCQHSTVIPLQIPAGIFQGLVGQPKEKWTAVFLCTGCGQMYEHSISEIRSSLEPIEDQSPRPADLWRIEYECVHENCGRQRPIYFSFDADASEIRVFERIHSLRLWLSCNSGHSFRLSEKAQIYPVSHQ